VKPVSRLRRARWAVIGAVEHRRRVRAARDLVAARQSAVLAGPFAGLRYPPDAPERVPSLGPKLLGSYEEELHPVLAELAAAPPATLVDIGAADGYYAVGLARRLKSLEVEAFEADPATRALLRGMARLNGVEDRVRVRGHCEPEDLSALAPAPPVALLCDAEGGEWELLEPDRVPLLRDALVIAELHPWVHPEVRETLERRFAESHRAELIRTHTREPAAHPALAALPARDAARLLDERRPGPMEWLVLRPGVGAPAGSVSG